ncbi:ComEC/Rec2 family competence protein [Oceanobacillus bengalensis]|uniref:MBL fold metallo-hydrolase n=1 Tax=Oceanobacillus bengalensis TaxID=1435466 RepID=A0A494YVX8_9BACI|nr:ComEC/Rec2 family competence protein [Oceanobacillus bengalensis]RKQ14375.1 MBL fold metallo-hydrolase [Oceanobacillus bengalensis]
MRKLVHSFVMICILLFPISIYGEAKDEMRVHFINVGQGDSILIQTPQDKTILIDGGRPEAGKKVVSYLEKLHIKKIDLLVATHPDYDHIGGLVKVMRAVEVKQILDTGKIHFTKAFARYVNEIRKQGIPTSIAKESQNIIVDPEVKIKVLNAHRKNKNNNESSIALQVSYEDIDFLLMSDVEIEQEEKLLKKYQLESEIIKVAHHGSDTSTSFKFLHAVKPQVAILTYSVKNDYGHPVERVIENLDRVDADVYSTAVYGDVVITTDGEDFLVLPDRSPLDNIREKPA